MHGGRAARFLSIEKSSEKLAVPAKKSSEKLAVPAKIWYTSRKIGRERTSLLGRSPACSFHAWRYAATKRSTFREHFEITFPEEKN